MLVGLIPVTFGLAAFSIMSDIKDGEQILSLMAQHYLPTFLYIVFIGALVFAIFLTVDRALLAVTAQASLSSSVSD